MEIVYVTLQSPPSLPLLLAFSLHVTKSPVCYWKQASSMAGTNELMRWFYWSSKCFGGTCTF
jgi:hypothetical protein